MPRPKPRRLFFGQHPSRLKSQVPVSRFEWDEVRPGALEVDLVEHSRYYVARHKLSFNGGDSSGHYAYSLSVVDIVSGWSRPSGDGQKPSGGA